MNDIALAEIQTRLKRVEQQNRVLVTLLCAIVGLASLGAAKRSSNVVAADEIRAHKFSVIDPDGDVVAAWYSDSPGTSVRQN
ncbi:MAG: hypothetical protein ABR970_13610 [Roseiarcus sp.]